MTGKGRPLVSVLVPVYQNKPYLEPALKSILALDYHPLEIIIQDDASPDDAFEAVEQIVGAYDGPHTVKIGKNDTNLSMGNYNVLMEKASGDYLVIAHDDDIQFPDRVSRLMDAFRDHDVSMVTSNAVSIDGQGVELREDMLNAEDKRLDAEDVTQLEWPKYYNGATLSWRRAVFDVFGPIDVLGTARTSDYIIPFRASLLNGIYYLKSPTMYRREHTTSRGSIGRNTNDANILDAERASEHITQWAYVLATLRSAVNEKIVDAERGAHLETNIVNAMIEAATMLARARNQLHLRKKRMAWIDHGAGAVTELDIVLDPATQDNSGTMLPKRNRGLAATYRPRWYQVALQHPLHFKRWIEAWKLQKRYRNI